MTNRAKLIQGSSTFVFEYDPQTFAIEYAVELASTQVLDKHNPNIRSKSSAETYKLSRCIFVKSGLRISQQQQIDALRALVLSRSACKFVYGTVNAGLVYIATAEFDIKSWWEGKPTHVEVNLTLKVASAEPTTKETPQKITLESATITPRMTEDYKSKIETYLKNPANLQKLQLTAPVTVRVDKDKVVTLTSNGKNSIYTLKDFGL